MMIKNAQKIIEIVNKSDSLEESDSFAFSKICSALLYSDDQADNEWGRKIVIHFLDNWQKIPTSHVPIWNDLVESAGFYPYTEKPLLKDVGILNTSQLIRKEYHSSQNLRGMYFHEEQRYLADLLDSQKNVIISAPTSFGKSLLIEYVVASKRCKNIVIVQPTLALLDETRKKLKKYKDHYQIIVKTSQRPSEEKGNLFLLTAERVMEYKDLPNIDFFVIDEFYKLSAKRDDERSDVLNNAFHLLLGHGAQFYLLSPNIDGISLGFAEKYDARFEKTNYSLVDNMMIDVYAEHKEKFDHPKKYKGCKESVLFDLLFDLKDEQTIIYCSSPERARKLSMQFANFLKERGVTEQSGLSIVEWISNNIAPTWSVIECLNLGIGIHDGALPKHMNSAIIEYFNEKKLRYLFCTSTIIEGVNTSAKNIIYFDSKKGGRKIDFFDYANIKGRSGRLMVHYVGRIFNFNQPPKKEDIIIDIPFFEQNPISSEVLIQLDEDEVKNKESQEYQNILLIPEAERKIIKENGMVVTGQQAVIAILKRDIEAQQDLICWNGTPTYRQLEYAISLAWDHLLKEGESTSPFTKKQITKITFDYGYNQDISHLIKNQFIYFKTLAKYQSLNDAEILDEAIRFSFQTMRHWFGYKIPKWLLSIDRLQKYVCTLNGIHPGDYIFYASQIENDFIRSNLTILSEYGIPRSAIKKLEKNISEDLTEDQVISAVKMIVNRNRAEFMDYEAEKIFESL